MERKHSARAKVGSGVFTLGPGSTCLRESAALTTSLPGPARHEKQEAAPTSKATRDVSPQEAETLGPVSLPFLIQSTCN